jgi:hypothetical protein
VLVVLGAGGWYAVHSGAARQWGLGELVSRSEASNGGAGGHATTPSPAPPRPRVSDPPASRGERITYPQRGTGALRVATGQGAVAGTGGELLRYQVAVEGGIDGVDVEQFAKQVATTLADPRSWTGGGRWRLQRVGKGTPADFTVQLTTPVTRGQLCGDPSDLYTSCRAGDRVVINVARWTLGVPQFRGDLATYRQYLVNHEVGHRLGHDHELCPKVGGPAPVMEQQTLGLHGCRPNAWPRPDGREVSGPPGAYDDPIPSDN